jgi:glycosyltransferase involved in cell wall biosynthesis
MGVVFSIIITTYNYGNYIDECITSCLNQEIFSDFEVIVVDDGSTDDTQQRVKKYTDNRLKVFLIENAGIEAASNFGINMAQGKYIIRVDADDKLASNFLNVINAQIGQEYNQFYYANYKVIDAAGNELEEITLPAFNEEEILSRGDFLATGTVFDKKALLDIGIYSEKVRNCGLENYELIIKMLRKNYRGKHIEESIFYYRRHASNLSETRRVNIIQYGNEMFKLFNLGKYRTNTYHPYKLIV